MPMILKKSANNVFALGVSQRYSNPIVKPKNVATESATLVVDVRHSSAAKESRQIADAIRRQPTISIYNVGGRAQAIKTPSRFF